MASHVGRGPWIMGHGVLYDYYNDTAMSPMMSFKKFGVLIGINHVQRKMNLVIIYTCIYECSVQIYNLY